MPKMPEYANKDRVIVPEGTHLATLIRLVDEGTQENKKGELKRKFRATFELPYETMEIQGEKRPLLIDKEYILAKGENSANYKLIKALNGGTYKEKFLPDNLDFSEWIGKPCQVSVVHNEYNAKTYANVDTVAAVSKGTTVPAPQSEVYALDLDKFDEVIFNKLPEWVQQIVEKAPEYATAYGVISEADEENFPWEETTDETPKKKGK